MLVVSQAVLSCGFSASSPELSCLYAVIHLGLAAPTCPAFLGMLPVVCLQKVAHRVIFSLFTARLGSVCPGESVHSFCGQLLTLF